MAFQLDWAKVAAGLPEENNANAAARVMSRITELRHWAVLNLDLLVGLDVIPPNVLVSLHEPFPDRYVTFFVNAQGNDMVHIGIGENAPFLPLTDDSQNQALAYLRGEPKESKTVNENELHHRREMRALELRGAKARADKAEYEAAAARIRAILLASPDGDRGAIAVDRGMHSAWCEALKVLERKP